MGWEGGGGAPSKLKVTAIREALEGRVAGLSPLAAAPAAAAEAPAAGRGSAAPVPSVVPPRSQFDECVNSDGWSSDD